MAEQNERGIRTLIFCGWFNAELQKTFFCIEPHYFLTNLKRKEVKIHLYSFVSPLGMVPSFPLISLSLQAKALLRSLNTIQIQFIFQLHR
jgi:hypothetical protein